MLHTLRKRLGRRRRAFTLIELVVAMAIVLILGGVAYTAYIAQIGNARTAALDQLLQQVYTGQLTYAAQNNGAYETDATNVSGGTVSTGAGYTAFINGLASAGVTGLPTTLADANITAWSYSPITTTSPATFTLTATATGGNGHVLCADPVNGVVDLGVNGTPATVGVKCK